MRKLLLAAAAVLVLGTPAYAAGGTCIRQGDVDNFTVINDRQVVLEDTLRHHKILAKLIGTCSNLKFDNALQIRSLAATDLGCVSPGDIIVTRDSGGGGRCSIVSLTPYDGAKPHGDDHGGEHHEHSGY